MADSKRRVVGPDRSLGVDFGPFCVQRLRRNNKEWK